MWDQKLRDGIHGASMASAIFDDKIEEKNQQFKSVIHLQKTSFRSMSRTYGW